MIDTMTKLQENHEHVQIQFTDDLKNNTAINRLDKKTVGKSNDPNSYDIAYHFDTILSGIQSHELKFDKNHPVNEFIFSDDNFKNFKDNDKQIEYSKLEIENLLKIKDDKINELYKKYLTQDNIFKEFLILFKLSITSSIFGSTPPGLYTQRYCDGQLSSYINV